MICGNNTFVSVSSFLAHFMLQGNLKQNKAAKKRHTFCYQNDKPVCRSSLRIIRVSRREALCNRNSWHGFVKKNLGCSQIVSFVQNIDLVSHEF